MFKLNTDNIPYNQKGIARFLIVLIALALLIVSIIVTTFAYKFAYTKGYNDANKEAKITEDGVKLNADGLRSFRLENELLKSEATTAKQERDITLANLANLRTTMEDLNIKNLQLEQTAKLYSKNIAKQGGIPLQIIGTKIEPLPENAFEYRFDVLQLTESGRSQTLRPRIMLLNETSFVEIPIKPSTYTISGVSRIRGRFIMPEGFTPRQIKLTLNAGTEELEQLYNWRFGKRKNDVPLSLEEIPETDQRPIN